MSRLSLAIRAESGEKFVPHLKKNLPLAHRLLRSPLVELSLALVGDKTMSRLHRQFMQIDGATDVLTFPLEMNAKKKVIVGEVVICVPYARRIAKDLGTSPQNELLLYALHGMLHLSGFDDRTARQFRRMHRMEDTILRRLGIEPVFNPKGRP